MIAEAGAAFSGIKVAMDMAKGLSALKTEADINQAVIDIQRALLAAQSAAIDDRVTISRLIEEKSALEKIIADENAWAAEKARYQLTQSSRGAFTYDLSPELAQGEVAHKLCVTCFGAGKKSILQGLGKHSGGELVKCQTCNEELLLSDFQHEYVSVGRGRYSDDF